MPQDRASLSNKEPVSASAGDPGSFRPREDPLEKEMATHSSILAWEIPWTEEPGRLQFMGSQKSWTWLSNYIKKKKKKKEKPPQGRH